MRLPQLEGKESKFRPGKHAEPVENSAALQYRKGRYFGDRQTLISNDESDLDAILKNIRELLLNSTRKLNTVSPDLIDQIYRFENLNDFTKQADLEHVLQDQLEVVNTQKRKSKMKRGRSPRVSVYSQFGNESNGTANLMS